MKTDINEWPKELDDNKDELLKHNEDIKEIVNGLSDYILSDIVDDYVASNRKVNLPDEFTLLILEAAWEKSIASLKAGVKEKTDEKT